VFIDSYTCLLNELQAPGNQLFEFNKTAVKQSDHFSLE